VNGSLYVEEPFDQPSDGELWDEIVQAAEDIAIDFYERHAPIPPPTPLGVATSEYWVGWSQPPRPADVIVSFDSHASARDQARAVLYDYYHDDPLRYWSDNEAVKRCFIGGKDPRKEEHDPLLLIAAYEDKNHPIWQCHGTGMTWADLDHAVQQAIAHRRKLGPLPKSLYDTNPVVIYYYDNDTMKRISYPGPSIPAALNPGNNRWWAWGMGDSSDAGKAAGLDDVHTRETNDPKKIAVERANPGWTTPQQKQALKSKYPWLSDMKSGSAGDWGNEQFQWDKDVAGTGVIGSITGAILALVSAVLDATGIGAVVGVPLGIATPFIVAAINATDTALHAGDFGAALTNLGPALAQAAIQAAAKGAGASGFTIPPAAIKALSGTVTMIGQAVQAGQKKKPDFGQLWSDVAAKAKSFKKIDDADAEAIAHVLGGPGGQSGTAGHVFILGYLAGKFVDQKGVAGIAKILQAYATFADPRIINIALLGMGIGMVSRQQSAGLFGTRGDFTGQVIMRTHESAQSDLKNFTAGLRRRYGLGSVAVGLDSFIARIQELLNDLWGLHPGMPGYIRIDGILSPRTKELVKSFQEQLGVHPADGNPNADTLTLLEAAWAQKWNIVTQGSYELVGGPDGELPPDWGALSRGCPHGYWWDSLDGTCKPMLPLPHPQPPPIVPIPLPSGQLQPITSGWW